MAQIFEERARTNVNVTHNLTAKLPFYAFISKWYIEYEKLCTIIIIIDQLGENFNTYCRVSRHRQDQRGGGGHGGRDNRDGANGRERHHQDYRERDHSDRRH